MNTLGSLNNPHDKLFKETFGDLEVTADFLKNYLPEEILGIIELESLAALKDSHIEPDLKESFSDLLFRININGEESFLYFLLEHKSSRDQKVAFQLLKYILQIWQQKLEKEKADEVPLVIPLVFYHGAQRWSRVKRIGDWIGGYYDFTEQLQSYAPDFNILLIDFSPDGEENIAENPKLQAYLQLMKHIYVRDLRELFQAFSKIEQMLFKHDAHFFDTLIIYILNARDDMDILELKQELSNKGGDRMASIADQLRREGEEKGIEKGEIKRARETARRLFLKNMDEVEVKEVTELPDEEIAKIKKELNIKE